MIRRDSALKEKVKLQREVGRERGHDFANVRLDNATKSWDGSRNGLFAQEAEDRKKVSL
jgi:hypothetical protein